MLTLLLKRFSTVGSKVSNFFSPLDQRSSYIISKEDRSTDILIWVKLVSTNVAL